MEDLIQQYLKSNGPSRSSDVAGYLISKKSLLPAAARQRLSRANASVRRLSGLLPKKEAFLYLDDDYMSEIFLTRLIQALRDTGSVYACALDGLSARQGMVAIHEFSVISGSADKQKGQIPNAAIISRLIEYGLLAKIESNGESMISLLDDIGKPTKEAYYKARYRSEKVILDAFAGWLKNLGMVSYDKVALRGDVHDRLVGPFKFDLTAPTYLLPMASQNGTKRSPGFVVADVFSDGRLDENQIAYFLKKIRSISAFPRIGRILPYLIAPGFSNEALRLGRQHGIVMATPSNLFGERLGRGIADLTQTLKNAGAVVSNDPARLAAMIERLSDIEGRSLNLRGILFELLVAYLVRGNGSWVQVGKVAKDGDTGITAEIDILVEQGRETLTAIECKGKAPNNSLSLDEVEDWIRRIPIWQKWLKYDQSRQDTKMTFEIWTSGKIDEDALQRLQKLKQQRVKISIDWKDGEMVRNLAKGKEKHICGAFEEHFFRHPLIEYQIDEPLV